jgi:hypothetical protein
MKINHYKLYHILFVITLVTVSCSCNNAIHITPVSREYNERFLTLQGLDPDYFSKKDVVQYYQVSGTNGLSPKQFIAQLHEFAQANYKFHKMDSVLTLNLLFYRKQLFTDYSKVVYESARDNENGLLEGYSNDLLARITYQRSSGKPLKISRSSYYYGGEANDRLELRDTISIK